MAQPSIQTSFAAGEWSPNMASRVDLAKYRHGAALLRNFFVDYRGGGASTRQGTKFANQAKSSGLPSASPGNPMRLIPFQPSSTLSYVLEFGQNYIRFYSNGSPILEAAVAVQSITGSPVTVNSTANGYSNGDWVFISGAYYIVTNAATNSYQLTDLFGNNILVLTGTQAQRVYTLPSPYNASDLFPNQVTANPGLKYVQDVTSLIICHPSYAPYILTINSAASWTLSAINFGPTIATPTNLAVTSTDTPGTTWYYSYLVTAVDSNNQESSQPAPVTYAGTNYIGTTQLANTITWNAVPGAASYNVYKASPTFDATTPAGAQYGFIQNVTGTKFIEAYPGILPDFQQTPPIVENPFTGAGVQSYTVTAPGVYTTVPGVTVAAGSGARATAIAQLSVIGTPTVANGGGGGYTAGEIVSCNLSDTDGVQIFLVVATASGGNVLTFQPINYPGSFAGSITVGNTPSNPIRLQPTFIGQPLCTVNFTWGVTAVLGVSPGSGYTSVPAVSFSAGAATATAVLGNASAGNPGVPGFFQSRLMLAAQQQAVQSYNMSQPDAFFNFNTSNPTQASDGISGSIIAEELNDIRSLIPVPTGIIALSGRGAWLINGGGGISTNNPITPSNQTANPQAFNGANDLKPQKINFDVIYGTNKGSYFRDLTYNIYANIYTGTDISLMSNHLFFGYNFLDITWAEEPFKTMWVVRNDGMLISLGFVKEQDLVGWAHHDTNGQFQSVCSVIETVGGNTVDAVYVVVQRFINGAYVQYVERMADRYFPYGKEDAWSVDCALQTTPFLSPTSTLVFTGNGSTVGNVVTLSDTVGAPFTATMATNNYIVRANGGIYQITAFTSASQVTATVVQPPTVINLYSNTPYPSTGYTIWQPVTVVSGLTQLAGQTVVGVADGNSVGPFVVSATGSVALGVTATKVTLGLAYLPQLQTLRVDLGEPTVQGKRKKIPSLTVRVQNALGLQAGRTFANSVTMKDFTAGYVSVAENNLVSGLVSGDGFVKTDPLWDTDGQLCIQQPLPYPATVLGVIPEITVGDTKAA